MNVNQNKTKKTTEMKKIFALIFTVAMLTACSGSSNKEEDQNDSTAVDSTIVDSTAVAAADSVAIDTVSEKK